MSEQRLLRLVGFRLVTTDLARLSAFYGGVLGFGLDGPVSAISLSEGAQLGLSAGGWRQRLVLGEQSVTLEQFDTPGAPYPEDGDASALWFQHLAIVVADIGAAVERLGDVAAISTGGPQRLPPGSGGVTAFKFHDPDGHPLELLQFPAGHRPPHWRGRPATGRQLGIGIDHSAIGVADVEASAAFYAKLGLLAGPRTTNQGPEQGRLDGLTAPVVQVVPLEPVDPVPHLELLGYQPAGPAGPARRANDVAATRLVWQGSEPAVFADLDGHIHQVVLG